MRVARHLVFRWRSTGPQRAHRRGSVDPGLGREARLGERDSRVELMGESIAEVCPGRLGDGERHGHWKDVEHVLASDLVV